MVDLKDFKAEPGAPACGTSYAKPLLVSGRLPNGFGAENTHELAAVTPALSGDWWGRGTPAEAKMVVDIEEAIERFMDAYQSDVALRLSTKERIAIYTLVHQAKQDLSRVAEIYGFWAGTLPGLPHDFEFNRTSEWPLSASDVQYEYMSACTPDKKGQWVEDRQLGLGGPRVVRRYYCATDALIERRAADRWQIQTLLRHAARAVRCADWTLWRVSLYRKSLADFEGVNAGDFIPPQPTPPKPPATTFGGPGGLLSPDYDPPPEIPTPKPKPPATTFPTSPVDAFIPRPGGPLPPLPPLPPPPIPPEGGAWPPAGGGPEGGEGPDPTWPEGTSPPPPAPGGAEPPSLLRAALPFAVGAGALGLFLMLR